MAKQTVLETATPTPALKPLDDRREMLSEFQFKVDNALLTETEWVETSPEIIKYLNPKGMNGSKFFIYKNVKVCEYGQSESVQEAMDAQFDPHGNEGIVTFVNNKT